MSIPEEVIQVAWRRLWFDNISDEWADTAPEIADKCEAVARIVAPVIAEWARKEALREALDAIGNTAVMGPGAAHYEAGLEHAADILRALAEGEQP